MVPCSRSRNSQSKPAALHRDGDLDAARQAHAAAEGELALFQLSHGRRCGSWAWAVPLIRFAPACGQSGGDHAVECGEIHRMVGLVRHRHDQAMAAQDEDALIRRAGRPCGIGRQVGEAAIGVAAEARGIAAAGVGRGHRVVGPAMRQQAFAVPHAVLHIQHAEFRVVAQRGEAGTGGDEVAVAVSRVLIRAHAQPVGEQPIQRRVVRQAAAFDAIADDRADAR